jgi:hypothetical protein
MPITESDIEKIAQLAHLEITPEERKAFTPQIAGIVAYVEQLVAASPAEKASLTGPGICDFYTPDGSIAPAHFAALTAIIDAYEAEEARVCAGVPNCVTDGGVRASWVDKADLFSGDSGHLNLRGQAAEAAQLWPVVAQLLGL